MWNPETYRDTDYGLGPDERFEPADDVEDAFIPADGEPYIQTVLGPIRPEEAGVTLVREFLQYNGGTASGERLDDTQAALLDLEAFYSASGRTIVSAATSGTGRDARKVRWLAQHAPVHIVAATGVSPRDGLPSSAMATRIERDLTVGMDGTTNRAGMLTIESGNRPTSVEHEATSIVADMHVTHGVPVLAEAADGHAAVAHARALTTLGVAPDRIVASFPGIEHDVDSARLLLQAGVSILFGRLGHGNDRAAALAVTDLVHAGYLDRILLSHGFARRSHLTGYGGRPGLPYVVEYFAVMLLEAGLAAQDVRRILVDNAARALALRQRGEEAWPGMIGGRS